MELGSLNFMPTEKVTLAEGCFWCLEAIYKEVKGVKEVESGYSGGEKPFL